MLHVHQYHCKVNVHIPPGAGFKRISWYRDLQFPESMEKSKESFFTKTQKGIFATEIAKAPSKTSCYHPENDSHPWIDHAFIAEHVTDTEECCVLYQDKINKDLPKAVKTLNAAAALLKDLHPSRQVLCIANVVSASVRTTSQKDFEYPYIINRNEPKELTAFYSVNFVPMAEFVRGRHR
jgi:hypothetical protein